jgi:predicted transposase YbfD/YdcC
MTTHIHPKSLSNHFESLVDFRLNRRKLHSLHDILIIAICAMLCGAETFVDFEAFGKAKKKWFKTFLELPNGIPSHDTFGKVFAMLDPKKFSQCFCNWVEGLRRQFDGEVVAIDGKTLKRSHDRFNNKGAIHMVSAWARDNGLVLGQVKVKEKSNEITAIPELLRNLELTGCIVTIDAMGCQKTIATEIINSDANYVLALKGNHETIHQEVADYFEDALKNNFKTIEYDFIESVEKNHGRLETRRFWITEDISWMEDCYLWEGLTSIAMVESSREINGEKSTERRFYLCSIRADAKRFASACRGHWSIENQLHWSLDVSFNEDQCRVRCGYAAENLAILRHMALNILKSDSSKKCGLKAKQKVAAWDHDFLLHLLSF